MGSPMKTAWTQPLKWTFIGLQLAGIYLVGVALFLMTLIAWAFFNLIAYFLDRTGPSYWDTTTVLFGTVLDKVGPQPWLLGVIVAAVVASVLLTYGAFRFKVWAHWGAMVLIALSIAAAIVITVSPLRDLFGLIMWIYCAASILFLAAMTIAAIRYGPWGMTRSP